MTTTTDPNKPLTLYAVTACTNGRQIPTFFLDADVQGIMSEDHARRIARRIVGPDADITVNAL